MSTSAGFKRWLENNWEKPFFEVEMHRYEVLKAEPGEENMTPVVMLGVFSVAFIAYCIYSAVKFL